MSANPLVDKLTAVLDLSSQQVVYTFANGTEFDQSYTLTGAVAASQGRDYGYDSLQGNAAPVAPRKTSWKFLHRYGAGETWASLKDAMDIAFGHGRPVFLQKIRPDGKVLIAEARSDGLPNKATTDSMVYAEFALTFTQMEDWKDKDITSPRYDTGLHYDTGTLHYDQRGVQIDLTGAQTTFTLTNAGAINERHALIVFNGPIAGTFAMVNQACDARGMPFAAGVVGTPLSLTITVTLATGEFLQIDSRSGAITSNHPGLVPWTAVTKAPGQRSLWEIVPGANTCYLNKGDGAATGSVTIAARSRWRS